MDYSVSSYLPPVRSATVGISVAAGLEQPFNTNSSAAACHFESTLDEQESPSSPSANQDHCNGLLSSSLLVPTSADSYASTALFHHSHLLLHNHNQHQSNYAGDDMVSAGSSTSPFHFYGAHPQRQHGESSLLSLGSVFGEINNSRNQLSSMASSSSSVKNPSALSAAAASLFGSSSFSSLANQLSRTSTCSSTTQSQSQFGNGSSFFPSNDIHVTQGQLTIKYYKFILLSI